MNVEEIRIWYLALAESDVQIFLSLVSHQLTVHGRAFALELTETQQIRAFRGLNELQHQISSQIASLGLNHDRYPDDVLWNILNEKAAAYGLLAHLKQSFDFARTRNVWEKSN